MISNMGDGQEVAVLRDGHKMYVDDQVLVVLVKVLGAAKRMNDESPGSEQAQSELLALLQKHSLDVARAITVGLGSTETDIVKIIATNKDIRRGLNDTDEHRLLVAIADKASELHQRDRFEHCSKLLMWDFDLDVAEVDVIGSREFEELGGLAIFRRLPTEEQSAFARAAQAAAVLNRWLYARRAPSKIDNYLPPDAIDRLLLDKTAAAINSNAVLIVRALAKGLGNTSGLADAIHDENGLIELLDTKRDGVLLLIKVSKLTLDEGCRPGDPRITAAFQEARIPLETGHSAGGPAMTL